MGCAIVGDDLEGSGTCINFPKLSGFARLAAVEREVERFISMWEPDFVMIEGFAFGAIGSSKSTLVEISTTIKNLLYRNQMKWFTVPPTTLKQWTTGKGNADKPAMAVAVKKLWGFESPSDDIIDAFALARMGMMGAEELLKIKGVAFQK